MMMVVVTTMMRIYKCQYQHQHQMGRHKHGGAKGNTHGPEPTGMVYWPGRTPLVHFIEQKRHRCLRCGNVKSSIDLIKPGLMHFAFIH